MENEPKKPARRQCAAKPARSRRSVPAVPLIDAPAADPASHGPWGAREIAPLPYAQVDPSSPPNAPVGEPDDGFGGHVRAWVTEEAHIMPFGKRILRSLLGGFADWGPIKSYLDQRYPEHCRSCGAVNSFELVSRRVLNRRSGYVRSSHGRQRSTRELWEYRYRCVACDFVRREEHTEAYSAIINPR